MAADPEGSTLLRRPPPILTSYPTAIHLNVILQKIHISLHSSYMPSPT